MPGIDRFYFANGGKLSRYFLKYLTKSKTDRNFLIAPNTEVKKMSLTAKSSQAG
ncbi:hypothetical protein [Pseudomonas indica]|uniref:hypothetical protein n=1 Tax=Pseudomonas indica TaxID=137658 RepID=UPI00146C0554|nr:hypothetical protein [Pseudomonas indica]